MLQKAHPAPGCFEMGVWEKRQQRVVVSVSVATENMLFLPKYSAKSTKTYQLKKIFFLNIKFIEVGNDI